MREVVVLHVMTTAEAFVADSSGRLTENGTNLDEESG
jgi:hypothetical protein